MNKIKVTVCYRYEYYSEEDAVHNHENIDSDFILKKSYETVSGSWVYEYEKIIL